MPDLFIMNDNGEYFGVSGHSYAAWHNYPKSINYWMGAEGSDAGRYFNIDEVELTQAQVDEFDRITKEYARLDAETPTFELQYPVSRDYKTKKAYNQAVNDFMAAHAFLLLFALKGLVLVNYCKKQDNFLLNACINQNKCLPLHQET